MNENKKTMCVLAVKQPYASLIAEGIKCCEIRKVTTNKRERIAIYASRSVWNEGTEHLKDELPSGYGFPSGKIIATAELYKCELMSEEWFDNSYDAHYADGSYFAEGKTFGWWLDDIQKLDEPVEYIMPSGCVVWSHVPKRLVYGNE